MVAGLLAMATPLGAQTAGGWNKPHVLELVQRAQALRRSTVVDPTFRSYQAEARGYVYFFVDRPDGDQRTLVKADQLALNVYWRAPNETHQTIVGRRDKKVLPTNIRYHLDHLTVVQDDFGEFIRIGNGDEVSAVLHPLGPGAENVYDYRLADSLSIRYGGGDKEVRVYEVQVRPKNPGKPGFVGSVYLDRDHAAIVRMTFTFTPASYVDPYLDHIQIALDNALWMGKYWLPYRQELEVRREMPVLDFKVGSVIRGRFEIGHYRFNVDLPPAVMARPRITIVPPRELASFPFQRGLFADLDRQGLAPTPSMAQIRHEAEDVMHERYLSGLRRTRLYVPSVSDVLRWDRAEGLFLGAGAELRPKGLADLTVQAGYAFGRRRASGAFSATSGGGPVVPTLDLYWDALRDFGPMPASSGAINTLSALIFGRDHLDPYFVRGARLTLSGADSTRGFRLDVRWEQQHSAHDVIGEGEGGGPVLPVDEGVLGAIDGALGVAVPWDGKATLQGTVGRLGARTFGTLLADARWSVAREGEQRWHGRVDAIAGVATQQTPVQYLYFLGGLGTLPGYPFRAWVGNRFWLVRAEGTLPLLPPWVGLRVFAAMGQTLLATRTFPSGWQAHDSNGPRASVGAGLSLGWDVLHLDLGRGLQRGGSWELTLSVSPRFRPWL
jgi:hypothetical protein